MMQLVHKMITRLSLLITALTVTYSAVGQTADTSAEESRSVRLDEFERSDGFLPIYRNPRTGQVLLEIRRFGEDILYFPYTSKSPAIANVFVAGGIGGGSSIGLDDDIPGFKSGVVQFRRIGDQVAVVLQNSKFRENGGMTKRLHDVLSSSLLAMLPIVSTRSDSVIVDIAPLVLRDAGSYAAQARLFASLDYQFDPDRSYIELDRCRSHSTHTELDVCLTFACQTPSAAMNRVSQDAKSLTIGMRHAFVKAPSGMRPRKGHPLIAAGNFGAVRINYGTVGIAYYDTAARYDEPRLIHLVNRYRLEKQDPAALISDPVHPITIYFDPRFPEPFRTAAMQAASDWNAVLETAGFSNAIVVKVADESVDPLDVLTNYVFWAENDTRGVSQGETFLDARTGEIVGFKVRIDSQRVRYHARMWNMMRGAIDHTLPGTPSREEYALHRMKMLVMHELGHGLGLGHNMSASVSGRASIMDYYGSPRFEITEQSKLKFKDWQVNGAGPYDIGMIRYLYTPLGPKQEAAGLSAIIREMQQQGLILTSFEDARWVEFDDYASPIENLERHSAERAVLLKNYGEDAVDPEDFMGDTRDNLQYAYLFHATAIERAVKNIGGYHESFAKRGGKKPFEFVPAKTQRAILEQLMQVISPENLAIPKGVLEQIGPSPIRRRSIEEFGGRAGDMTDPLSAARTLVAMVVHPLLSGERAQRLLIQSLESEDEWGLEEVIKTVLEATYEAPERKSRKFRLLQQITRDEVLIALTNLASDPATSPEVRATVEHQLNTLNEQPTNRPSSALPRPKGTMN